MRSSFNSLTGASSLSRVEGYHPWWSHRISTLDTPLPSEDHYRALFNPSEEQEETFQTVISSLPPPRPLKDVSEELKRNLQLAPSTMLGEVGIDRAFRVRLPSDGATKLSPFTVPQEHQLAVLEAQIDIAVELKKNISLHSVKASGATVELFKNMRKKHGAAWEKINIDLHSCTLSGETWKSIEVRLDSNLTPILPFYACRKRTRTHTYPCPPQSISVPTPPPCFN